MLSPLPHVCLHIQASQATANLSTWDVSERRVVGRLSECAVTVRRIRREEAYLVCSAGLEGLRVDGMPLCDIGTSVISQRQSTRTGNYGVVACVVGNAYGELRFRVMWIESWIIVSDFASSFILRVTPFLAFLSSESLHLFTLGLSPNALPTCSVVCRLCFHLLVIQFDQPISLTFSHRFAFVTMLFLPLACLLVVDRILSPLLQCSAALKISAEFSYPLLASELFPLSGLFGLRQRLPARCEVCDVTRGKDHHQRIRRWDNCGL